MKMRMCIWFVIIALTGCVIIGCGGSYFAADSGTSEEIQFVCDLELEPCETKMALYKYSGNGLYSKIEYEEAPEGSIEIKHIQKPLSTDTLYAYLQSYVNKLDYFLTLLEDNVCRVTGYQYEYILKGIEGDYYLIPVIRFSIQDYGNVYLDIEYGCMIE